VKTREEQVALDRRYMDWHKVYVEETVDKVKHWGDRHKRARPGNTDTKLEQAEEGEL
jgi:hypothetical protein